MTFELTPTQFAAKAAQLKTEHGIAIDTTQPNGSIKSFGAEADWKYDGTSLSVTVVKKPFLVSEAKAESMIAEFFQEAV